MALSRVVVAFFDYISSPSFLNNKFAGFLGKYLRDVQILKEKQARLWQWRVKKLNQPLRVIESQHGKLLGAACYTMMHRGGVRFYGNPNWFRLVNEKVTKDVLEFKDVPIECLDFSNCELTSNGLEPLFEIKSLRYLNLSRCPYIDDFALSRLHVFHPTLEVLILAGCPQITERGLASLHHLENLKHLDISDLPRVSHKSLTRILLEEMMPESCEIVGMDYLEEANDIKSN